VELAIATRILARAGVLPDDGRVTLRVGEVMYVAARGVSNHTVTPYDTAIVRVRDGDPMWAEAPDDAERYLARYRADGRACAVIAVPGALVEAESLASAALAALRTARADDRRPWPELVGEARASGVLIGILPASAE